MSASLQVGCKRAAAKVRPQGGSPADQQAAARLTCKWGSLACSASSVKKERPAAAACA